MSEEFLKFSGRSYSKSTPKRARWDNVKIGSKIHIMTEEEFQKYYHRTLAPNVMIEGLSIWGQYDLDIIKEKYLGKKFTVNATLYDRIQMARWEHNVLYSPVVDYRRVYIPLGWFVVDDEGVENFPTEEKTSTNIYHPLKIEKHDKKIIKEMIDKVDKDTFKAMLSLGFNDKKLEVGEKAIENYLNAWAESKYEYYLMLGKNLSVKKEIDYELPSNVMRERLRKLRENYNYYSLLLNVFCDEDYFKNICPKNKFLEDFCEKYKAGMKLSKFLSKYLNDSQFDIDYSKVLQDKVIKSNLWISIDPCDYMTVSINKNDWKSCHNIVDGCYGSAPYSLMLDDASLVGFVSKGTPNHYEFNNINFDWNSKQARLMINIDKNTGALSFNKPYPALADESFNQIRYFTEEILAKYLNIENRWKVQVSQDGSENKAYIAASGRFHYTDPMYYLAVPSDANERDLKDVEFRIGVEKIFSLDNGEPLSGGSDVRNRYYLSDDGYNKYRQSIVF